MRPVTIVPTGTANTASVVAALSRLGAQPLLTGDAGELARADHVVLPGVGTFGAAMGSLDRLGLRHALVDRIAADRATLAVCVGMQVLAGTSEESPKASGLGVIDDSALRFDGEVGVPQLGWNRVTPDERSRFLDPGWAYFANSYRLTSTPEGWLGAASDHGGPFVSAMERGNVLACQFHPELSGAWGNQVLERWLDLTGADL